MKTIPEVSALLAARVKNLRKGKMALCDEAGITARTLRNVLSGSEDYKVSTLLALVNRLGMELVIVPREVAGAVQSPSAPVSQVKTSVQAALDKLKGDAGAR